jgi:hypothetical protein
MRDQLRGPVPLGKGTFQPTHPREAQPTLSILASISDVSIHAPARGATTWSIVSSDSSADGTHDSKHDRALHRRNSGGNGHKTVPIGAKWSGQSSAKRLYNRMDGSGRWESNPRPKLGKLILKRRNARIGGIFAFCDVPQMDSNWSSQIGEVVAPTPTYKHLNKAQLRTGRHWIEDEAHTKSD